MNLDKIIKLLKEKNINESQVVCSKTSCLEMKTFHGEIENYSTSTTAIISITAKINNKIFTSITSDLSNSGINGFINGIINASNYIDDNGDEIYSIPTKYKKYNLFNKELPLIDVEKKKNLILDIESKIRALDKRIKEVEVYYEENEKNYTFKNTFGLKGNEISNTFSLCADMSLQDGEQIISENEDYCGNDFNKFNEEEFINNLYKKIINKLNPVSIKSDKYKVVFSPDISALLLGLYVKELNAEKVIKNISKFKDKLNSEVASKKVTIIETPLKKDLYFRAFDFQGVPTQNLTLIKKGVLQTYLHNLRTAKLMNTVSNGHASPGTKIGIAPHTSLFLKPGKITLEDLCQKIKDGIYITSFEGLHAGYNSLSGDMSLKSEGFLIKDGKIDKPIKMMTLNSNIFDIFKNIKQITINYTYSKEDCVAPAFEVDKIAISY